MAETVSTRLSAMQMLSYYYERRAQSEIGSGARFLLKTAVFGTSSLVTENSSGTYDIAAIPTDFELSDMTTQFATSDLTLSYAEGTITIRVELNSSQLDANTSYPFNTMVICDSEGVACAVLCIQEDQLYQGKGFVSTLKLKTGGAS
ncbi:phage tail protein [Chimaeribacter californicus]|uniref:Phage tail protein n=1 Tax=Chimaeribacter californicus TaxID=2060067 RepID=A0A2N5DSQ3_9GAMM|nr:phage tail protein [Chimaeribacter californicus]PLR29164.1 phage tail protein [Chimaeribacter californicus]